jgi:hypothetical protein
VPSEGRDVDAGSSMVSVGDSLLLGPGCVHAMDIGLLRPDLAIG